ncbi:hypothetical protein [Chondrinema litorale]|uniref:hypothetical protein n=1 Tax=Chondrinema litorale TaxID=2994555 RepID=UPI0025436593|nr:hypothetical protein [Chondrinema litorale]UZR95927.1 hypothetical protein OQ292_08890 [Chondrinema litorale]
MKDYEGLNQTVSSWSKLTKQQLKLSLQQKGIADTGTLQKKILARVSKKEGIADRVAFRFPRYGVFVEKGVGKGRPVGSRRAKSLQKAWFNPIIEENVSKLAEELGDELATINARRILIR